MSDEDIEDAVRDHPMQAAEALARIRVGRESELPSGDGLDATADQFGVERAKFWVQLLKLKQSLATFASALQMTGVLEAIYKIPPEASMFDPKALTRFFDRLDSFRCTVRVDGNFRGSGILVGPSSALTAWHVTAVAAPRDQQIPVPTIEVELADRRRIGAEVVQPSSSPCGENEWKGQAPKLDDEVAQWHDVALLRLKQPAGIHLAFAALASPPSELRALAAIMLVSYPDGEWKGVEYAKLRRLYPKLTARWGYDVQAAEQGSSGGGCFDTSLRLAGIHQAGAVGGGRLVPLIRFDGLVRTAIEEDETPDMLWSLDGTPDSSLVVGRDAFFTGYQAAMREARARGLWIRRIDLTNDVSGLPFSFELLSKLVARSVDTRLVRVSFDAMVNDLPTEVARRATEAGVAVDAPAARSGVAQDQTEPEAVIADRSRLLAQALDAKARSMGVRLWVFFDHPSLTFGDEARWALTAFVDQAMRLDSLRVALAGFEAVQMPGEQFEHRFEAQRGGGPGLMVEYLTHVRRVDVINLIKAAAKDMGRPISPERVEEWTDEALQGLASVNERYDSAHRATVAARLQPKLQALRKPVGEQ